MIANKKIPALRFKEFEGEWNCTKIEEISKVGSGGTPNRSIATYWNGDIPWITTSLIDSNKIDYADEYITKEGLENSSAKLFPSGAVLMAMYGQGKTRGKVAILGIEATTNQACAAIIVKQEIINPKYLFQNFTGRYDEVRNLSNAGGQENLSGELIKNLKVCFPSLSEQQKIASFLTAVDDKIQQLTKKNALLEQYKKGVMQQIFNQQIRFKDDDGNDYPDWEEKRLGDITSSIKAGKTKPENEGFFNVYGSTGIIGYCKEFSHSGSFILIARVGANAGKLDIVNGKFGVTDNTLVVDGSNYINLKFLFYLLLVYNLNRLVFGSGQPLITGGQLSKLLALVPSKEEQQKIANFLTGIDNKIDLVNQQLEKTKEFKKGLLQQMFV